MADFQICISVPLMKNLLFLKPLSKILLVCEPDYKENKEKDLINKVKYFTENDCHEV